MVFVRYIHNKTIEEAFLFCCPLETSTKANDMLKLVEDFFQQKIWLKQTWEVFAWMGHLLCSGCDLAF